MDYKESDVEAAFAEYLKERGDTVIGRQVELPSGRMDILAVSKCGAWMRPIVVEIKKGKIDLSACGQLWGYVCQVDMIGYFYIANVLMAEMPRGHDIESFGILVGDSIEDRAARIVAGSDNLFYYKYERQDANFSFSQALENMTVDESSVFDPRLRQLFEQMLDFNIEKIKRKSMPSIYWTEDAHYSQSLKELNANSIEYFRVKK